MPDPLHPEPMEPARCTLSRVRNRKIRVSAAGQPSERFRTVNIPKQRRKLLCRPAEMPAEKQHALQAGIARRTA